MRAATACELELDLEVFTGPFDLLLTLILKEEIDLLEVDLAEIVVSYIDVLEARGDLDLEVATEFLVLIAALLELKSRLMLPRADGEADEDELEPEQALEELLERLLDARRFRLAADHLVACRERERGVGFRSVPPPTALRRGDLEDLGAVYRPRRLASALEGLLRMPQRVDVRHITAQRVTVAERLTHLRRLLRGAGRTCTFEQAVDGADRVTVCVTLFALLEMYKQGEVTWAQDEPFGEIVIVKRPLPEPDGEPRVHDARPREVQPA